MTIQGFLKDKHAGLEAREWAQDKSFQEIWETCTRVDWLIWLLKQLDFQARTFQELSVSIAESVTHLMPYESQQAVVDIRRWLNGEKVDLEIIRQYTLIAGKVNSAADVAAYAADAVYAGGFTAANDAVFAAYHASRAVYGGLYNADTDVANTDIIRLNIPFNQVAQAARQKGIDC